MSRRINVCGEATYSAVFACSSVKIVYTPFWSDSHASCPASRRRRCARCRLGDRCGHHGYGLGPRRRGRQQAEAAPKPTVPAEPVLTAKASVKEIKAWTLFSVTGSSKDLTAGSTVTLQQKQGKKWVTLPAKTKVNKSHKYALKVKLGLKGKNSLRMVGGGLVSPVFYIKVK